MYIIFVINAKISWPSKNCDKSKLDEQRLRAKCKAALALVAGWLSKHRLI